MSDSEEDSNSTENNWPMNEDWLMGILKGDNQAADDIKVKINVRNLQVASKNCMVIVWIIHNSTLIVFCVNCICERIHLLRTL